VSAAASGEPGVSGLGGPRREIHRQAIVLLRDTQRAAAVAEIDRRAARVAVTEQDVGTGEGRVAAEIHLDRRREPAQPVLVPAFHDEGRLGQVVFGGDRLHRRPGQRLVEQDDGGGVAPEQLSGERVD